MTELNEFCQRYLPEYFARKYNEQKLNQAQFDFKKAGNVFEMSSEVFSMMDQLMMVHPYLEAVSIIQKNFLFKKLDLQNQCRELRENTQTQARFCVRKLVKKMPYNIRQQFQIFIRLVYLYFDSRETHSNEQKDRVREDCFDEITVGYNELKFTMELQNENLKPFDFMEYIINILLRMRPNYKFGEVIKRMMSECMFPDSCIERVNGQIKKLNLQPPILEVPEKKLGDKKKSSNSSSDKQQRNQNQQTPVKQRSRSKAQKKTLQTSEKKQTIIQRSQSQNDLQSLKKSLNLHKKVKTPFKQRTLYMRNKYLVPKKANLAYDQNTTGSNNNKEDELFILEMNRSFSSRYLDLNIQQEEDFLALAGATPKPKKKVKLEKTYTGTFDQKGNFIPGF